MAQSFVAKAPLDELCGLLTTLVVYPESLAMHDVLFAFLPTVAVHRCTLPYSGRTGSKHCQV